MHQFVKKPKVLFILKKRQTYGQTGTMKLKSAGLYNSALFMKDMLVSRGYQSELVQVVDNNCIDREVAQYKPDVVIIEALWVVPEKFEVLRKLHPHVKWIVRLHSELPFLANEGIALEWVNKYVRIKDVYVAVNSKRTHQDLKFYFKKMKEPLLGTKIEYLPNYFPVSNKTTPAELFWDKGETINIGCFGAIRPMKNHLTQAVAAIRFADEKGLKLRFHVNAGRVEQHGEVVLRNLRALFAGNPTHELVEHAWMDRADFLKVIDEMDLGLQVSLSETFNIVSADFVDRDIPMVTSKEVVWMPSFFTAHPTSVDSIVCAMKRTLFYDRHFIWMNLQRRALIRYSKHSIIAWEKALT